jgi:hypothetical protein
MGNNSSTQNIQFNLNENLLPKMYVNEFIQAVIKDIINNIGQGINNMSGTTITTQQLSKYINNIDLISQCVTSISTIIAQNITPSIINTMVNNAMNNNKSHNLNDFTTKIKTINANINDNFIYVANNNLINLIENIVQDNLNTASIKVCFLSHTSKFVDTSLINPPNTPTAITSTNIQNSLNKCTDLESQLTIIINNLITNLDIKITAVNTIKTREQYIQEFKDDVNKITAEAENILYKINQYGFNVNTDIYDKQEQHKLLKKLYTLNDEQMYYQNKINMLTEQEFLSPTELQMINAPPPTKEDLDISGNTHFSANIINSQEKIQNVNKIQNTNQTINLQNNLTKNQNVVSTSNIDLTSNKNSNKQDIEDKPNKIFGIHISGKVSKFIYICCSFLLLLIIISSIVVIWRIRRTAQMASSIKDMASNTQNDD